MIKIKIKNQFKKAFSKNMEFLIDERQKNFNSFKSNIFSMKNPDNISRPDPALFDTPKPTSGK